MKSAVFALMVLLGSQGFAATKLNTNPPGYQNGLLSRVGQGEWLVIYGEGGTGGQLVRVNERGEITYGPVAPPCPEYFGVWNRQVMGGVAAKGQKGTYKILFRLLDRDGNPLTTPVTVSPPGLDPFWPVVIWAGGEFAVQYCSEVDSQSVCHAISLRRIDATGALASPELVLYRDPDAWLKHHLIVRLGNNFFSAWIHGYYTVSGTWVRTLEGAWYDENGQRLTPLTAYYQQQAPGGKAVELWGLAAREDHVTMVYSRIDGTRALPAEQIQIDLAGAIVDGPRQIGDPRSSVIWPTVAQEGLGVMWANPGFIYLQRVADDGILSSASLLIEESTGTPFWPIGVYEVSHQNRAYGIVWWKMGPYGDDVYFEASPGYEVIAAGAGPLPSASPVARLLQPETPNGPAVTTVTAYGSTGYGVNVGSGAITGDEVDRLLTGAGPGPMYGPQVRAFDYRGTALPKVNFYAYGTLRSGVKARGGDLDGDATHEILTTPGPGSVFGPHVRGFQFDDVKVQPMGKVSFYAYRSLKYGANGDCGNLDADATREIVTGPGPGPVFGSQLRGFQYDNAAVTAMGQVNVIVFPASSYGLAVAPGDTDWDGYDELAAAAGPDPSAASRIAIYDFDGAALLEKPGSRFEAFAGALGGAQLSFCQWWDTDLNRELLASRGPLPSSSSEVRAFDDSAAAFAPLASFNPYPTQTHGTTLASIYVGF